MGNYSKNYAPRSKRAFDDDFYENYDDRNKVRLRREKFVAEVAEEPVEFDYSTLLSKAVAPIPLEKEESGEIAVVKWFNSVKGFGFVKTKTDDLFVHISVVKAANKDSLAVNEKIKIVRGPGKNNNQAVVKILE